MILGLLVVALIAQIVPYPPAENPPVGVEVPAPSEVRNVLRTACYDCHSNETVWPWYSRVIPAKWFVRHHVLEGRESLNFSTWETYSPERAEHKLEEVVEMVEEGAMPLASYLRMHADANLSPEQEEMIVSWARELMTGQPQSAGSGEVEVEADTAEGASGG